MYFSPRPLLESWSEQDKDREEGEEEEGEGEEWEEARDALLDFSKGMCLWVSIFTRIKIPSRNNPETYLENRNSEFQIGTQLGAIRKLF